LTAFHRSSQAPIRARSNGSVARPDGRRHRGHPEGGLDVRLGQVGDAQAGRGVGGLDDRPVQGRRVRPRQGGPPLVRQPAGGHGRQPLRQAGQPGPQLRPRRLVLPLPRPPGHLGEVHREPPGQLVVPRDRLSGQERHDAVEPVPLRGAEPVGEGEVGDEGSDHQRQPPVEPVQPDPPLLGRLLRLRQRHRAGQPGRDHGLAVRAGDPAGERLLLVASQLQVREPERQVRLRLLQRLEVRGDDQHRVRRLDPLGPRVPGQPGALLPHRPDQLVAEPHELGLAVEPAQHRRDDRGRGQQQPAGDPVKRGDDRVVLAAEQPHRVRVAERPGHGRPLCQYAANTPRAGSARSL
jgi:hypothetical protein